MNRSNPVHPPSCQLHIEAEPRSGAWNMACDEALLNDAVEHGRCHVRIYRWAEPTLSLGYFQRPEDRATDPRLVSLPAVRRLSGGGAILHDDEWTYSCAIPATHPLAGRPLDLYVIVHEEVIAILARHGVTATFRGVTHTEHDGRFLCFVRGDERDLVVNGSKILGSAQRRRMGAVLQHGSLLLGASEAVPEIVGIRELVGFDLPTEIGPELGTRIASRLGNTVERVDLDHGTTAAARSRRDSYVVPT